MCGVIQFDDTNTYGITEGCRLGIGKTEREVKVREFSHIWRDFRAWGVLAWRESRDRGRRKMTTFKVEP